jgi:hypothetical protein
MRWALWSQAPLFHLPADAVVQNQTTIAPVSSEASAQRTVLYDMSNKAQLSAEAKSYLLGELIAHNVTLGQKDREQRMRLAAELNTTEQKIMVVFIVYPYFVNTGMQQNQISNNRKFVKLQQAKLAQPNAENPRAMVINLAAAFNGDALSGSSAATSAQTGSSASVAHINQATKRKRSNTNAYLEFSHENLTDASKTVYSIRAKCH